MHQFLCKVEKGKIVPIDLSKINLLDKVLYAYELRGNTFKLTIESHMKPLNHNQTKLYNAYIIKASEYFGNTFKEMENLLLDFFPKDEHNRPKIVNKWTTHELTVFKDQTGVYLSEYGFKFE